MTPRLLLLGAALLGLSGCPKPLPPQASARVDITLAASLQGMEAQAISPAPEPVVSAISQALSAHNLGVVAVDDATIAAFNDKHSTPARLDLISSGGQTAALLVESEARFSAQLSSRYRWTVAVRATLAPAGGPPRTVDFVVPVHLIYAHQREAEALREATPMIVRRVNGLVEDWIADH